MVTSVKQAFYNLNQKNKNQLVQEVIKMKQLTTRVIILGILSCLILSGFNSVSSSVMDLKIKELAQDIVEVVGDKLNDIGLDFSFFKDKTGEKSSYSPGELIIKFKDKVDVSFSTANNGILRSNIFKINFLNELYGAVSNLQIFKNAKTNSLSNVYKIIFPEDTDLTKIANEYRKDPNVEYAEPNYVYQHCSIPNDPRYFEQWALPIIDAPDGWDIENGSSDIVIAITDTGVDYNHLDLKDNIWINPVEDLNDNGIVDPSDFNGIDDDGNGCIDDLRGWDFVNNDNDPVDDKFHGTHCAGIAAAVTNNSIGIAGVAYGCKIMPVKGLNHEGSGTAEDLAKCITYAAENGADVISMSWGGGPYNILIRDSIAYASSKDVVLVAAAGNCNNSYIHYPSSYKGVISVSATDENDEKAHFSNYGYNVDVAAPGMHILSTFPNNNYNELMGTSMSCPHVSGLAALILSKNTCSYNQEMVTTIIKNSVDPVTSEHYIGTGRINLTKALTKDPAVAILDSDLENTEVKGTLQINGITWSKSFQKYILEIGKRKNPDYWIEILNSTDMIDGELASFDTTNLQEDGLYTIRLTVVCDDATYYDSVRIVVNNIIDTFTVDNEGANANFSSIIEAVENSGSGDTVYVYEGIYNEVKSILIERSIDLIGEKTEYTIINGAIGVNKNNVNISGFSINIGHLHGAVAVCVDNCEDINISNNAIYSEFYGLGVIFSRNVVVYNNTIKTNYKNEMCGIRLISCNNTLIEKNKVSNADTGCCIESSENISIVGNLIRDNDIGVNVSILNCRNNMFYHNIFINNANCNAYDEGENMWYNSSLEEGNYWDDYRGDDNDGDGIGDIPYDVAGGSNQDLYPLGYFREYEPPNVSIIKPEKALYLNNRQIRQFLFRKPLIIGKINITVNATDDGSGIERVEIYIDGEQKANITAQPFYYMWKKDSRMRLFGHTYTIKAVAFDKDGNSAQDCIEVNKFL